MKAPLATLALAATIAAPAMIQAQAPGLGRPQAPAQAPTQPGGLPRFAPTPPAGGSQAPAGRPALGQVPPVNADPDVQVVRDVPPPIPIDQLQGPSFELPTVSVDQYLVRVENGPFMVLARTFRGPDATKYALALTLELRNTYKLPAYIFHLKSKPGGSNIRGVQPTAPEGVPNADIAAPEKYRVFDEAAVLVGNCRSIDEAEKLLKTLKGLKSRTLDGLPTIWGQRKGSFHHGSFVTANPLHAAQHLFPGPGPKHPAHRAHVTDGNIPTKPGQDFDPFLAAAAFQNMPKKDPLVERMNQGPRSLYKNPGLYTLPVAEFTGRQTNDENDPNFKSESFLRRSPLASAADDAELLAEKLAKCRSLNKSIQPYVYHDRFGSKVTLGSFNGPDDPQLVKLREDIPMIVGELLQNRWVQIPLAPAPELMPVPRK